MPCIPPNNPCLLLVCVSVVLDNPNNTILCCRVARQAEDGGASPYWWCDPGQAGYGAFLFQGIKDWCAENEA